MSRFGSDTPFMLIARLKVQEDKVAEYLALADKTDKAVEASEPGMLHHTFDQDPDDPLRFVWSEFFKNDDENLKPFYYSHYLLARENFLDSYIKISEFLENDFKMARKKEYFSIYLIVLISKKQYVKAKEFLEDKEYNFKEKLKPIWFALMTLMQKEYPNEIKKMGSELEESVSDILKRIKKHEEDDNS